MPSEMHASIKVEALDEVGGRALRVLLDDEELKRDLVDFKQKWKAKTSEKFALSILIEESLS